MQLSTRYTFYWKYFSIKFKFLINLFFVQFLGNKTGIQGSSNHEQGSSWAMEVGNNMKVCPVTVENIGTNGQMLVEVCW